MPARHEQLSLLGPKREAAPTRFVLVVVERGIDAKELTYGVDAEVAIGQRVEVPLGKSDTPAPGIVVATGGAELLDGLAPGKSKRILRVMPARIAPGLVALARWMSAYYLCPLGMVVSTMFPAGVKHDTGRRIRVEVGIGDAGADASQLKPAALRAWQSIRSLPPDALPAPAKALARRIGAASIAPINRLLEAGLLTEVKRSVVRAPSPEWAALEVDTAGDPDAATPAQTAIVGAIEGGSFAVHLVYGVTGSGKTEVYLRAIQAALGRGESAIVLVPEISLTPQTAGRFIRRFKSQGVAVLHSGLSASERNRQWSAAAAGEARVVVGARSAIFAPMERLGIIVVDEEHESGYKQDQLPRYNARDVAIKRAQIEGCPVILGSATPSMESWSNAIAGRSRLHRLTERLGGGALPRVQVVDMVEARRARAIREGGRAAWTDLLSVPLEAALRRTLDAGGQSLLLLNRRGFANHVCCANAQCGWVMRCDQCDVSLVMHRWRADAPEPGSRKSFLRCHHCLSEQLVPRHCPVCAGKVTALGTGTQRLEEELARKFPVLIEGRTMVRADSDTMRSARDWFGVLARFASSEIRVLLGTQMIAKGLDFPNVRLVGVIDADTALALPDFRASERTFQLVSQVAGRAGRSAGGGMVIVQTIDPHHPAIEAASRHDYEDFAAKELDIRARASLPPATRMARIVVRDKDSAMAQGRAEAIAQLLQESERVRVIGPGPCPIERIAGFHRVSIEVLSPSAQELHAALAGLRVRGRLKSDARTAVDVDPMSLM